MGSRVWGATIGGLTAAKVVDAASGLEVNEVRRSVFVTELEPV